MVIKMRFTIDIWKMDKLNNYKPGDLTLIQPITKKDRIYEADK